MKEHQVHKSVQRATIVLALTPVVSFPAVACYAAVTGHNGTTITTPAPPGDSSAVGAEVDGVVTVAETKAHAGPDGGSADADALSVLGQQISGGSQQGVGSKSGNLIGTGSTPVGDAEVAPWAATVTHKNGGTQSASEAALAHANGAGLIEVWLLHSRSLAGWTPAASTGDSSSDGAEVSALNMLDIKILHSEAHSTGKGEADLLVVNGNAIGSSDQANGACKLSIPALLDLNCLTASGGPGKDGLTSETADVATFGLGSGSLTGTVSGAASSGGKAPEQLPTPSQAASGGEISSPDQTPGSLPSPQARGTLPFTGADSLRMALEAIATSGIGGTLTLLARRRRSVVLR